jgi:hypothetical protein
MHANLQKDLSELARVVRDIMRLRPDTPVNPVLFSAFGVLYRQALAVGAPELEAAETWGPEERPTYQELGLALERLRSETSLSAAQRS